MIGKRWTLLAALMLLASCGGDDTSSPGGGAPPPPPPPPPTISVSVVPASAQVAASDTFQFSCSVAGSANTQCNWSVRENGGGTISASGLYNAPSLPGTYHVVATSAADASRSASATVTVAATGRTPWVTGYYAGYYWDQMYPPQEVDMSAMTHFVFGRVAPGCGSIPPPTGPCQPGTLVFAAGNANQPGLSPDGTRSVEDYLIKRAHDGGAKALLMLGGDGADGEGFVLSTADNVRAQFVRTIVDYLVAHDYDGVDVDWENKLSDGWPERGVSGEEAIRRLKALIVEIRAEANSRPRYRTTPVLVTFPGYAISINEMRPGGLVDQWRADVANLVDQYNLMSYGIGSTFSGGSWDSWFTSPIFGATGTRPVDLDTSVAAYVRTGVPRERIGIGIGFYGVYFGPPIRGPRQPTGDNAYVSGDQGTEYNLLVELGYLNNGTYHFDEESKSAYRVYDEDDYPNGFIPSIPPHDGRDGAGFLSYENAQSIGAKGEWVRQTDVGGTIIWMVNYGYLPGQGPGGAGGTNPLLAAVKCSFLLRGCPPPATP